MGDIAARKFGLEGGLHIGCNIDLHHIKISTVIALGDGVSNAPADDVLPIIIPEFDAVGRRPCRINAEDEIGRVAAPVIILPIAAEGFGGTDADIGPNLFSGRVQINQIVAR